MTKEEILQQVAERYRSDGYTVMMTAGRNDLPTEIPRLPVHVALIAQKNGESVAVEVLRRDQLHDINPSEMALNQRPPGWNYDLVVYPPNGVDGIPLEDGEPNPEYVESLVEEAQQLLEFGKLRGAFLVAWSAIESTMRTAARREELDIENGDPRFVLKTLYSNGALSYEDYDRLRLCLDKRNRLVHGLSVEHLEPNDVRFIIEFTRHLLCAAPASSDA
jgi:REase_AHJR-like